MDPLVELLPELQDLITQHFDVKDFIELTTVSKLWNENLGKSNQCLKKIKFTLRYWIGLAGTKQDQREAMIKVLQSTMRTYQHVTIDCRFDKSLSLEVWKFFSFLGSSVVELKIKSIKLDYPTEIQLTKLKILKLTYVPINVRNILLVGCRQLTRLKLKMESPLKWSENSRADHESLESVKRCMLRNQNLESIELHGSVQYNLFFENSFSDDVRFKLKHLKLKTGMRLALISAMHELNLVKFLATQSKSLESFFIDVCRPHIIQHVFNKMPALTSIHFDVMILNDYNVRELKLILNEKIEDLKIPYVNQHQDIREFLEVVPNLKSLFVAHLSHETMEFIARNLMSLVSLKYRYDEIDCEEFYDRLKDDFPEVNQDIEMIVDYEYT